MYYDLYALLADFFYGPGADLTVWMEMTLTVLSTIGLLFVFAVPFFIVWACLKWVFSLCDR